MKTFNFREKIVFVTVLSLSAVLFAGGIQAQTRHKKKTTKKTAAVTTGTPKPLLTPKALTGAEIISRAGDYDEPVDPILRPKDDQTVTTTPADAATTTDTRVKNLASRVKKLETDKADAYEQKQKRVLMNLDILTKAEQRSESLRKQIYDLTDKENSIKTRLDQIETDIRPDMIERLLQTSGSLRPEEIREARKKALEAERRNLQSLLTNIQATEANLTSNLERSDMLVEKLRTKLEKDLDDSFLKDEPEN